MRKLVFLVFILLSIVLLTGCKDKDIIITFNSNGGNQIEPIAFSELNLNDLPIPIRDGHTFLGWFLNEELDESLGKNFISKTSTTFYAKWQINALNTYTVSFETDGGSDVTSISAIEGTTLVEPLPPVKIGYTFLGWYEDSELLVPASFSVMPSHNTTFYAKWSFEGVSIVFDSQGGTEVETMIGIPGNPFVEPSHPTREGFVFSGWFISISSIERYTFDTIPDQTITLYADWGTFGLDYALINDDQAYEVGVGDAYEESSILIPKYHQDKQVTRIMDFGFQYADYMNIIHLPETIIEIGNRSFMDASSLNHIYLPDRLEVIGPSAFRNCYSLEAIHVSELNQFFHSIDGVLFSKDLETLIQYPQAKSSTSYVVPDHVKIIGENAFSAANNLTSLDLGNGVTTIMTHAFYKMNGITSLVIPDQVTMIELYAFRECYSLESITLGSGLTSISSYLFDSCVSLSSIIIPYGVVSIGYGAFYYCTNLRSIYIVRTSLNGMITGGLFMFTNTPSNLVIYFPDQATVNDYKVAYLWSSYASKMQVGTP